MFGFLGWLFGASFISAIFSWLALFLWKALVPEVTAAADAVRSAIYAGVWGVVTAGIGQLGFKRTARRWRRKGSFVQHLIDVPNERRD